MNFILEFVNASRQILRQIRLAVVSHIKAPPGECNLCGYRGPLGPFGNPVRTAVRCPECRSLERHRLFGLAISEGGIAFGDRDIIHFAPEAGLRRAILMCNPRSYRTSEYAGSNADLQLDIENMSVQDDAIDVLVASHVLEHVDDRKALAEAYRVLRPGGHLILMLPIVEGWDETYEDSAIMDRAGRELHFGQFDHVRRYGADVRDRVRAAGFQLSEFTAGPEASIRYRLALGEKVFICEKPRS